MEQWIQQELEKTELGDKRRTHRLMKIVSNLSANPSASVPLASRTWAETKATYDFWDSPYLQPSMILQGHIESTVERIAEQTLVLAIQDTTELNYTSHKALSGAGYLDSKSTRGLKVHSTFVVTTQGVPQGIIGQQVWAREPEQLGKAQTRHQRATKEKESQKWLDGLTTTETIVPKNVSVVTIADREADFYDLFADPRRPGSELLIRGTQNRCLTNRTDHLWPAVESVEVVGTLTVELPRNPTRPSRTATLDLRYT